MGVKDSLMDFNGTAISGLVFILFGTPIVINILTVYFLYQSRDSLALTALLICHIIVALASPFLAIRTFLLMFFTPYKDDYRAPKNSFDDAFSDDKFNE